VQKYESGVRVTDLVNMYTYSMSKSTISTITRIINTFLITKRLGKGCFGRFGTHYVYFHYFLWGKIVLTYYQLDLRPALANELSS
jgi:hypothetical protein